MLDDWPSMRLRLTRPRISVGVQSNQTPSLLARAARAGIAPRVSQYHRAYIVQNVVSLCVDFEHV
jgi:hypothetical protein